MPTFIDESGDTGPCGHPDHCYFRLAAVWVPTLEEAEAIRQEIREVRRTLQLRADYEFKFSKTWKHPEWREAFFQAAMKREFRFAFTSIDKSKPEWSEATGHAMHWDTATELAATLRPTYLTAHLQREPSGAASSKELVLVDDNEDRQFLATVKEQFRGLGQMCSPAIHLVGKVKFRGSQPEELMQLVDMVCGTAGAYIDGKTRLYETIASRDLGTPLNAERARSPEARLPFQQDAQSSA